MIYFVILILTNIYLRVFPNQVLQHNVYFHTKRNRSHPHDTEVEKCAALCKWSTSVMTRFNREHDTHTMQQHLAQHWCAVSFANHINELEVLIRLINEVIIYLFCVTLWINILKLRRCFKNTFDLTGESSLFLTQWQNTKHLKCAN